MISDGYPRPLKLLYDECIYGSYAWIAFFLVSSVIQGETTTEQISSASERAQAGQFILILVFHLRIMVDDFN